MSGTGIAYGANLHMGEGEGEGGQMTKSNGKSQQLEPQTQEAQGEGEEGAKKSGIAVPQGYSFTAPAKKSRMDACVQGDLESWQKELYGRGEGMIREGKLRPTAA
eukprot:850065-Rhodomonas_salina.1